MPTQIKSAGREKTHTKMLEAALARPGVSQAMKVYGSWREKDQGLDPYRSVFQKSVRVTTTNSSNSS